MKLRATVLLALLTFAACASTPTPEQRSEALASRVFSPYCPGILLSECQTQQAAQLRGEIDDRVKRGESDNAILQWVSSNFGQQSIADGSVSIPFVWGIPFAGIGLAAIFVAANLRRKLVSGREKSQALNS